jgi:hypothetical protein
MVDYRPLHPKLDNGFSEKSSSKVNVCTDRASYAVKLTEIVNPGALV